MVIFFHELRERQRRSLLCQRTKIESGVTWVADENVVAGQDKPFFLVNV